MHGTHVRRFRLIISAMLVLVVDSLAYARLPVKFLGREVLVVVDDRDVHGPIVIDGSDRVLEKCQSTGEKRVRAEDAQILYT